MRDVSQNPFQPCREQMGERFFECLRHLDSLQCMPLDQKHLLRAVLSYTLNTELSTIFPTLSDIELEDLVEISMCGLKNLRSWGGAKPSSRSTTPFSSRNPSRAPSPTPQSGRVRFEVEVQRKYVVEPSVPGRDFEFWDPLPSPGTRILSAMSIETPLPTLDGLVNQTRLPSFDEDALQRQERCCAITGQDFEDTSDAETAHLFPYSAFLNQEAPLTFFFLVVFLGRDIYDDLTARMNYSLNSCGNRITMRSSLHRDFDSGRLFLQPFSRVLDDENGSFLDVRLVIGQPLNPIAMTKSVLTQAPDQQCVFSEDGYLHRTTLAQRDCRDLIPGEIIRLSTSGPERLPLPFATLLWWHRPIWQVIGAAELSVTISGRERRKGILSSQRSSPARKRKKRDDPGSDEEGDEDDIPPKARKKHPARQKSPPSGTRKSARLKEKTTAGSSEAGEKLNPKGIRSSAC
ncbi:hypothetical protein ABW21_db0206559 [Orbilia brochopaga]|nr:hypothetical protein ABW21_db0206559 [Drechslerella brochopaga]